MAPVIVNTEPGTPAAKLQIQPGSLLRSVNGHEIEDVLDYKFYTYDALLRVEIESPDGHVRVCRVQKQEGEPLGFSFETYLMDKAKACANRCVFCFVDQLPRGLRKTLYFKDDDARLSFLMGNYITMTNLSDREIRRIKDLRVSPLNISVHATDPEVRSFLLGNPAGARGFALMREFAQAGITMNCQIVCCPGVNDGAVLQRSMEDLAGLYPAVASVSIVPVGLTRHRERLYPLKPFDRQSAAATVAQIEQYAEECLRERGSRIFFASDELYLKAELPLPEDEAYEDYPQLENGVGMLRLLTTEFQSALSLAEEPAAYRPFSIATGVAAAPFLRGLLQTAQTRFPAVQGSVYAIQNDFFGHSIDVAGLVTGGDLIAQLRGKLLGSRLLIPQNMLRHGETVFLDDVSLEQAAEALRVPVVPVPQDGFELLDAMLGVGAFRID